MAFECLKNCGKCCGVVPLRTEVWEKNKGKAVKPFDVTFLPVSGEAYPATGDGYCVFLDPEGGCVIYDDRPDICRVFGLTDKLPCPFIKVNGNRRSKAMETRLLRRMSSERFVKDKSEVFKKKVADDVRKKRYNGE